MSSNIETSTSPKRLIYFKGHRQHDKSVLITRVCKNYETLSKIFTGECATRTFWNLYNLHTVRGLLDKNDELIYDTSMSGPHHYFGFISPFEYHTIVFKNNLPVYISHKNVKHYRQLIKRKDLTSMNKTLISNYNWIKGKNLDSNIIKKYNIQYDNLDKELINTKKGGTSADSLFNDTGVLEIMDGSMFINVIRDPQNYDLTQFKAQIVKNDIPFAFTQELINKYEHAQHKLRVVTYNYGYKYFDEYIMSKNGIFIERHEFIQSITPTNDKCCGYVVLGREIENNFKKHIEFIAITIPFGYTLLVEPFCIHGDSALRGLYSMAMTGNHTAMGTADTVLMKNFITGGNFIIDTDANFSNNFHEYDVVMSSNLLKLDSIKKYDGAVKRYITDNLGFVESLYWACN